MDLMSKPAKDDLALMHGAHFNFFTAVREGQPTTKIGPNSVSQAFLAQVKYDTQTFFT